MTDFGPAGASRAREPIFSIPAVVVVLVGLLLATHGGLTYFGAAAQDAAFRDWAFIPGRLTISLWPSRLGEVLARINDSRAALEQAMLIRHFNVLNGGAKVWTLATYALLHGSWAHVGVNCIWLVAFGPPIARRFGALRFLLFFGTTAVAGALAHWALSPMDFSPLIGASAADSGLMAAAARFVFQPSGLAVAHHDLACQRWRFGPPDACDAITGIDVAIFEKGFIKALYVFVDGGAYASLAR